MTNTEKKVDTLVRYVTTSDPNERLTLRAELLALMQSQTEIFNVEEAVRSIFLQLGVPDHLLGHPYAVQAIVLAVEDRLYIDNITFLLYPKVAAMFDTTASRVERAIRSMVETTWARGDANMITHYFGNTVSPGKGKPTNGEFIARIAHVVRAQKYNAS